MMLKKINHKKDLYIFFLIFVLLTITFFLSYLDHRTLSELIEHFFFEWKGRRFYFGIIIFPWLVTFTVKSTLFKNKKYTLSLILKLAFVFMVIFSIDLFLVYVSAVGGI